MREKTTPVFLRKRALDTNNSIAYFFCFALLGSALYTFYLLVLSRTAQQSTLFFGGPDSSDTFMDFFNVLKYISTRDPYHYTEFTGLGEKAYPPLAYVILYPFSRLFDYVNRFPSDARGSQFGIMSLMIFLGAALMLSAYILYKAKTGSSVLKSLTVLAMLSSGVYLFTVERANLILITMPLLAIFLLYYKSENSIEREIAYIALACATGLKVYPVVFGILLLKDKQWFASIRTMLYGAAAFFLPFLFFKGGFSNFFQLLSNVKLNSLIYQFQSPVYRFGFLPYYLSLQQGAANYQFYINLGNILLVLSLVFVLSFKSQWKSAALLTCALIASPTNSAYYCGIYLFIPIILFLNEEKHSIFDWVYAFLFLVILTPFQFSSSLGFSISGILSNYALIILYIILLAEALYQAISSMVSRYKKLPHAKDRLV